MRLTVSRAAHATPLTDVVIAVNIYRRLFILQIHVAAHSSWVAGYTSSAGD